MPILFCASRLGLQCSDLKLQFKRLHEFEQGVDFWCRFEGFNACGGGLWQAAPFCECSLSDIQGGAPLNHRRNNGCNLFHASTAFCINRRYISSLLKDIFDDSSNTIIILGESY